MDRNARKISENEFDHCASKIDFAQLPTGHHLGPLNRIFLYKVYDRYILNIKKNYNDF